MDADSKTADLRLERGNGSVWLRITCLVLLLILVVVPPLYAQESPPTINIAKDIRFDRLSVEDGLSQVTVNDILQDSQGFIWIGTADGLNKYDGYEFTTYKYDVENPNSLGGNTIQALHEDAEGNLWIGTDGGGLNKFDRATEQFTRYQNDPDDPHSLSSDSVFEIYQDRDGTFWIGTFWGGGLNKFDPETGQFTRYDFNWDDPDALWGDGIWVIFEDSRGTFWVGTESGGLHTFDRESGSFTHYLDKEGAYSMASVGVRDILEDRTGNLWFATYDYINEFNPRTGETTRYIPETDEVEHMVVSSLLEDTEGTIWFGDNTRGFGKIDREMDSFTLYVHDPANPRSISGNAILTLYQDQAGVMWIGTELNGLNKFDPQAQKFAVFRHDPDDPQGLQTNAVFAITQDAQGTLWLSTDGRLNKLDPESGQATGWPELVGAVTLFTDRTGRLWMGRWGNGISEINPETGEVSERYLPEPDETTITWNSNVIMELYETSTGGFWAGSFGKGLYKFDRDTGEFVAHYPPNPDDPRSLRDGVVITLLEDTAGTLWVGTAGGGLHKFDPETGEVLANYQHDPEDPESLSNNSITAIHVDRTGTYWLGTADGLNQFDPDTGKVVVRYGLEEGLPNTSIGGILEDEQGNLWLSTGRGIVKFDPRAETFKTYGPRDGVQGYEFNRAAAHQSPDGQMFFGGTNGLNAFYPDQVQDNPYLPPIVLTDFQLFNESVPVGPDSLLQQPLVKTSEIELSHRDYVVSFEFAALHYSYPPNNQYAYVLEGFEEDWNYVGDRRFATYTNLPPGDYTFRVKGTNSDGVWNKEGVALGITVTPPFWQTWWFITLSVVALAGVGLGVYVWRTRNLREQQRRLERLVKERTAELSIARDRAEAANRAKSEFLSKMSHELRTPLNGILGFAQVLRQKKQLAPETVEGLDIIQQSGEHLLTLIDDVLDLARVEAGRMELYPSDFHFPRFLETVVGITSARAEQKEIDFLYEPPAILPLGVRADEKRLRQVLLNLLGNAVKFTKEGSVTFRVFVLDSQQTKSKIRFEVADTGVGMAPDELNRIFLPFEQVGDVNRRAEGTGLGLAISRGLVRDMGSDLYVESELGKGSTFWFELELPVAMIDDEKPEKVHEIIGYELPPALEGRAARILIVDDKAHNRTLLVKVLKPLGFDVMEAEDGQQAIALARDTQPDVIFMDVVMPVLTGIEATQEIRKMTTLEQVIIVAMSASVFESDKNQATLAGCDAFVAKPVRLNSLFDVLETHLGLKWVYEEVEESDIDAEVVADEEEELVPPPPEEIEILLDLALGGKLQRIQKRADEIEEMDAKYAPFARKLRAFARAFEEQELLAFIKQYDEAV